MSSKRAFIYVRQSVNHEEGIERGVARCIALIESRGWEVAHVFSDNDVSATKVRGPKTDWAQMLAAIGRGEADYLVGVDLDRLVRSIRDLQTLIDLGIKVVTVDGEIDLSTADGEFRATMLAGIARFEVRRKSERQLRGNAFRIANGLPVAGGRRRFGFESDHLTVIEGEAHWLRHAYAAIAAGKSIRSVARDFNKGKVYTVAENLRNKEMPVPVEEPKGLWNAPRIAKLLVNPAYRGQVVHFKQGHPSEHVPRIIEDELADKVLAIMAEPTRRKSPGTERTALLSQLAFCGTCGAPLISAGTKTHGQPVNLYACSAVKSGVTHIKGHPAIRRAILDKEVRSQVIAAFMFGRGRLLESPESADIVKIDIELGKLATQKQENLALVGKETGVTVADIRSQLAEIEAKRVELARRRDAATIENAFARMLIDASRDFLTPGVVDMEAAADVWGAFAERYDSLPLEQQRTLVRGLLEIEVFTGRGSGRIKITHKVVTELNDAEAA
jgi:site-specific DNA recombinase